jgi:two-component system, NarL family, response regulator
MTKAPDAPVRVMVVDDHHVVRQGLIALLGMYPEVKVVADAADGPTAVRLYRQHRPDVTLMDLRMPGQGGVETITELRAEFPDSRFLVLSTYDVDQDIHRALRAGARGYLLKDVKAADMVATIVAIHQGRRQVPPKLAEVMLARTESNLTERELEVLQFMAKGASNKEIARGLSIAESTVKAHVNAILNKLDVSARTEAVVVAVKRGLVRIDGGG